MIEEDVENEIKNGEEQDKISSSENEGEETEEQELKVFFILYLLFNLLIGTDTRTTFKRQYKLFFGKRA